MGWVPSLEEVQYTLLVVKKELHSRCFVLCPQSVIYITLKELDFCFSTFDIYQDHYTDRLFSFSFIDLVLVLVGIYVRNSELAAVGVLNLGDRLRCVFILLLSLNLHGVLE